MRRAVQIAGILLIVLLGAGPASAAVTCMLGSSAMDAACPMGIDGMGSDCPMSQALNPADCSQDCCNPAAPNAVVLSAIPVKPRLAVPIPQVAVLSVPPAAEGGSLPEFLPNSAANSPPRHILLRVFRI